MPSPRIFPIADDALTVEFGQGLSLELHEQTRRLDAALAARPFAGFQEAVPAYASLTVFYAPDAARRAYPAFPTAYAAAVAYIERLLSLPLATASDPRRLVEIPVCYDLRCAPDLPFVAERQGLSAEEVIARHCHPTYRVFMLGFLPGFAYLGLVDERIAAPRHPAPASSGRQHRHRRAANRDLPCGLARRLAAHWTNAAADVRPGGAEPLPAGAWG